MQLLVCASCSLAYYVGLFVDRFVVVGTNGCRAFVVARAKWAQMKVF